MYHTNEETGIRCLFTPQSEWITKALENKSEPHFSNDVFEKCKTRFEVDGEITICKNYKMQDLFCKKVAKETYEQYLESILMRDFRKEQWIYNILDGTAEQDAILHRDDQMLVIPDYKWDGKDKKKMHILTLPYDRTLRTIRDLNGSHVGLLEHCKTKTLEVIKATYGFDSDSIKMYIHYAPTTYHLHIHFVLVWNTESNSSVEYSHELSTVIFNLQVKSDYYQSIIMNKRI